MEFIALLGLSTDIEKSNIRAFLSFDVLYENASHHTELMKLRPAIYVNYAINKRVVSSFPICGKNTQWQVSLFP